MSAATPVLAEAGAATPLVDGAATPLVDGAAAPFVDGAGAAPECASREHVDVREVALDPYVSEAALRTLSDEERKFAARLRLGAGAWVAARTALRRILGRYLGLAPAQVALEAGANGKPRLATGGSTDLRFNLSHSGDVALVAVRLGLEVGVDVEQVRPGVDGTAIAREIFTASERAAMAGMADGEPGEAFFRAWVRREALAKATGRGIMSPPAPDSAARYTVRDLDSIPGFAAALASEGADWSVRWFGAGSARLLGHQRLAPPERDARRYSPAAGNFQIST